MSNTYPLLSSSQIRFRRRNNLRETICSIACSLLVLKSEFDELMWTLCSSTFFLYKLRRCKPILAYPQLVHVYPRRDRESGMEYWMRKPIQYSSVESLSPWRTSIPLSINLSSSETLHRNKDGTLLRHDEKEKWPPINPSCPWSTFLTSTNAACTIRSIDSHRVSIASRTQDTHYSH